MSDAFLGRLKTLTKLDGGDIAAFAALLTNRRVVARERQIVTEGETPRQLHIVVDGWAARVKWLPDGRRHLSGLIVPGDVCDVDGLSVRCYDYGVVALTKCTLASADRADLLALCDARPAIFRALAWLGFVDNAMLNENAASLARRTARERLLRLFCELKLRLEMVGQARDDGYDLPLTQENMADALGMTGVHLNRMLRQLKAEGLVEVAATRVRAPTWSAVNRQANFSPAYLHLDGMRPTPA